MYVHVVLVPIRKREHFVFPIRKLTLYPSRLATDEELQLVHTKEFIDKIKLCSDDCYNQFYRPPENFPTYTSNSAFTAAACAVGGLLGVVDAVCSGKVTIR